MELNKLYEQLNNKNVSDDLIIFKNTENNFIANQYTKEIANQKHLTIIDIDSLDNIRTVTSMFDAITSNDELQVCRVDKFDANTDVYCKVKNLIIYCNTIDKKTEKVYNQYIVNIPKLEDWQIKDYIFSQLEGFDSKYVDSLYNLCAGDINKIQVEIDRLKIFDKSEQSVLFDKFIKEHVYNDINDFEVFDFVNSIVTRNKNKIVYYYNKFKSSSITDMGFTQLLYGSFKNIILVQCSKAPSAETCGMKSGQFYAVSKNINHYRYEELIDIFLLLTDIDKQIKTGMISDDLILDKILVNII